VLLIDPRHDGRAVSLELGDALAFLTPPATADVDEPDYRRRGDDPPELRADEPDQQQDADELKENLPHRVRGACPESRGIG
jgi:hypothetical protein